MSTSSFLSGRHAVVTGAGSGIGRAAAVALAAAGADVALLSRTAEELDQAVGAITAAGGRAYSVVADVADAAQMTEAFAQVRKRNPRLDVVFANAGINGVWAGIEDLAVEEWDRTLSINLRGTFLTVKLAVPLMKQHGGSIIVTSSVNGTRMFSNTGASAYSTSKAGQVAFARMCALELACHQIRINTICPGWIATEISDNTLHRDEANDLRLPVDFPEGKVPLTRGKPGSPEQVAQLVCFLASAASNHITGAEIFIDGGQSLFQG